MEYGPVRSGRPAPVRLAGSLRGGLLVAGPLAEWMSYLWGADATSDSVIGARNFAAPLTGYSMSWGETLFELREAPSLYTWFKLLALISLGTQAMVLVAVRAWTSAWWRVGIASCALMLVPSWRAVTLRCAGLRFWSTGRAAPRSCALSGSTPDCSG